MMPIIQLGQTNDSVLRQLARPLLIEEINSREIQELINNMREVMYNAPGVGLAAPQIGYSLQVITIHDQAQFHQGISPKILAERGRKPIDFHVIINPTLTIVDATDNYFFEGCLSICQGCRIMPRKQTVKLNALNEKAEAIEVIASGWYARILQHECQHLAGKLLFDFARAETEITFAEYKTDWLDASATAVKQYYEKMVEKKPLA
jgi:peptide deformylase